MFGRRKREEAAAAEAAREAERRALFQKLAERPEHVCPFLGLADERTGYIDGVSDEHRCFAFGDPAPLSAEQQTRVCQERGYGNCPRYLRGVLVIPTEELEALRRPRAPIEAPAPPPPPTEGAPRRRRASPLVGIIGVLLLVAVGAAAAVALFGEQLGIGVAPSSSPEPSPTTASAAPSVEPTPLSSQPASVAPTPTPTPVVLPSGPEWPPALPTPGADATSTGWIVAVQAGELPVVRINEDGTVGEQTLTEFSRRSGAPVDRLDIDGVRHWMTLAGVYTRLAYVDGLSGGPDEFVVFESFENPDGTAGFLLVPDDER